MSEVDLSDLARGYNFRPLSPAAKLRAQNAAGTRRGILVDLGGGTGGHADVWADEGRMAVVVDPSLAMCEKARSRGTVEVVQGVSQAIPLVTSCADLVYFHLSIHYGDHHLAIQEASRILRSDGDIEIWTFAPESMDRSALARWFPRIGEIDAERFPRIDELVSALESLGWRVSVSSHPETVSRRAADWALAVRNRFVSTIQFLTQDEIDEGLARFTSVFPESDQLYTYTIDFVRIRASL